MSPSTLPAPHPRLRGFIAAMSALSERQLPEPPLLEQARALLRDLVSHDDWLPAALAEPHPQFYRQYLLHADVQGRFSVVSFVWGPGQATPIHDHTVWGLIGMLRGEEMSQTYVIGTDGRPQASGEPILLKPGDVEAVSPRLGDIHRVHNRFDDRVSISIHVYGANIGRVQRWVYPPEGGRKPFVSGYSVPGVT